MAKPVTTGSSRTTSLLAALTALAIGAAALGACKSESTGGEAFPPPPEVSLPEIKQARWKIKTHASGAVRKVTRAEQKRLRAQRPELRSLVRDVYDSLFLYPSRKKSVLQRRFTKRAARTVVNSSAGVPGNAELVRTQSRRAVIGVQPNGARRAAAVVVVRAKGQLRNRIFRIVHKATLWLERPKRRWKVIGFEVRQGPVKRKATHRKRRVDKREDKKRPANKPGHRKRSKERRRRTGRRER